MGSHKQRASNHPEGEMMHVMIPTYRHIATHTQRRDARRVEKKEAETSFLAIRRELWQEVERTLFTCKIDWDLECSAIGFLFFALTYSI